MCYLKTKYVETFQSSSIEIYNHWLSIGYRYWIKKKLVNFNNIPFSGIYDNRIIRLVEEIIRVPGFVNVRRMLWPKNLFIRPVLARSAIYMFNHFKWIFNTSSLLEKSSEWKYALSRTGSKWKERLFLER